MCHGAELLEEGSAGNAASQLHRQAAVALMMPHLMRAEAMPIMQMGRLIEPRVPVRLQNAVKALQVTGRMFSLSVR